MEDFEHFDYLNINCKNISLDSLDELSSKMNKELLILTINVRSLRGKFPEFLSMLSSFKSNFTFIVLTEVWLDNDINVGFNIQGYNYVSCLRNDRGGGIIVYYIDSLQINIIEEMTGIFDSHESLLLSCHIPNYGDISLWSFYRPPHLSCNLFVTYLENNLTYIQGKKCVLTGDFNVDIINDRSHEVDNLINTMTSFGLACIVDKPTYFSPILHVPTTCLDHFWHNLPQLCRSFVVCPPLADHMGIIMCIKLKNSVSEKVEIKFRDFSFANKNIFKSHIERECNMFNFNDNDIDLDTIKFINWVKYLVNKYFPIRKKVVSNKRALSPWITTDISKCIDKKHRWFRMLKARIISYTSYRNYCNLLKCLLRAAERNYYYKRLESFGSDAKSNWRIMNGLLGGKKGVISEKFVVKGELTTDGNVIANEFGDFFQRIPIDICTQLPHSDMQGLDHILRVQDSVFLTPCTPNEIYDIVLSLKNSGNETDLVVKMLKLGNQYFSVLISCLVNMYFDMGAYPDALKIAKVIPIHKSGSKTCISNYRPISILGNLNKIFEKLLYCRLSSYFECNNLLSPNQFGFRRGVGTETAMLHLVANAMHAFEDGAFALGVFVDFSKAFDTVNHHLLLSKLEKYGVRGIPLALIRSYLSNRMQYVAYRDESSVSHVINVGVPQGSCLGPLLYNIYTNDLHNFIANTCYDVMYADDTTLISVSNDIEILKLRTNEILQNIFEWCKYNRLAINVTKTKAMIFSNRTVDYPVIKINDHILEYVDNFKYLGVLFDSKLRYQNYIINLQNRISRLCGISYRLGVYFTMSSAKSFYYAFFYSTISYCIVVWGGVLACSQRGSNLERIQKRLINNLFGKFFRDQSFENIIKQIEILKLVDIFKFRVGCIMYKMLNEQKFPALLAFIDPHTANHIHNTRNVNRFVLPFPRVENIRLNFKYQFLKVWNEIPIEIKSKTSHISFKSAYRGYLLSLY
jgi:hypothetical protein